MKKQNRLKCALVVFAMLVPMYIIGLLSDYYINSCKEQRMNEYLQINSRSYITRLDDFYKSKKESSDSLAQNDKVRTIFYGRNKDKELLNRIKGESNYIDSIILLDAQFNVIDSTVDTTVEQIADFKEILKNNKDGKYCFAIDFNSANNTIYICNGVFENNELIGYTAEEVSGNFFEELCKSLKLQENSMFYVMDGNGKMITSGTAYGVIETEGKLSSINKTGLDRIRNIKANDKTQSGIIKYKNGKTDYVGYLSNSNSTGYTLAIVTDASQYGSGKFILVLLAVFTILFAIGFIVVIKSFIPKNITNPIERLTYTLDRVRQEHNYSLRIEKQNDDQIGKLTDSVNLLLENIESIDNQVVDNQKKLTKKAENDPLTGIRNKGAMEESVTRMIEMANANGQNIVAGFVDIDNFRDYNTKYGHQMGDRVIQYIADTLNNTLDGVVGRVGGDEFMFCDMKTSHELVEAQLKRLYKKLSKGIYHDEIGENVVVTCSIGVVLADGSKNEELTLKSLTKRADNAMYQAKNSGKNQYRIVEYDEQLK